MWINGEPAVFEGQLKRGPTPVDTYYDEVDIAPFLKKGKNRIAIQVWYFGKDGFAHKSSGLAAMAFECQPLGLISDGTWLVKLDKAFERTNQENPNYRISESNIRFNATKGDYGWTQPQVVPKGFANAKVVGAPESAPWNNLIKRPIPLFKDYGIREYENQDEIPAIATGEWITCRLPYNSQVTPLLDIEAPEGLTIRMQTDNFDYMGLGVASVRAEYISKEGRQAFESLGWMNGHVVNYLIPKGVKINSLSYRKTGYDCTFTGSFDCDDPFFNKLWKMAARTLFVSMRDTYMDCPDRERAQWWGDLVNQSGQAFYALSPSAAEITRKGMLELINWQRPDGVIFSPVPAGIWDAELPDQMLASIGYYGFWNYYLNTGDRETIVAVYPGVKRYLDVWGLKGDGTLVERQGDWYWGDWGELPDRQLLFNGWYYLALKGYLNMAELVGDSTEAGRVSQAMIEFKKAFNTVFWDGAGYRTKDYEGTYDDRAQALAVVSGLVDRDRYHKLLPIFASSYLASPYMEKYVLEALFVMEAAEMGLERMKRRYLKMVTESPFTTLDEHFNDGERVTVGSNNHAWSGGALTVLSQYACGLRPSEAGWATIEVKPRLGNLHHAMTRNETKAGVVAVVVKKDTSGMDIELTVPPASNAVVHLPANYRKVIINGTPAAADREEEGFLVYRLTGGIHNIQAGGVGR